MHLGTTIVFLLALLEDTLQTLDLDTKDGRCGKDLIDTLNKYCYAFYNYDGTYRDVNGYNNADNIVNLCCNNPCTIRELIRDYCAEVREEYKPDFAATPSPPAPLVQEKNEKTNAIVPESSIEQQNVPNVVVSNTTPKMVSKKSPNRHSRCKHKRHRRRKKGTSKSTHTNNENQHSLSPLTSHTSKRKRQCTCRRVEEKNSALLKAIEQNVHKKASRPARIGYANVRRQNYILVDESIPHLSQEIQFESLHSCLFGC